MQSLRSKQKMLKQEIPARNKPMKTWSQPNGNNRTVRECAFALLEYRDRTEFELSRKLCERGYGADEIEKTVIFLKECRY